MPSVVTAPQPSVARTSARRTVGAVFFVHGLLFASWAAHIPHVKARVGLTDGGLGLVLLATPIGSIAAMAIGAWLIPRVGSRRMVACVPGRLLLRRALRRHRLLGGGPVRRAALLGRLSGHARRLHEHPGGRLPARGGPADHVRDARPVEPGRAGRSRAPERSGSGIGLSLTVQLLVLGAAALPLVGWALRLPDEEPEPHGEQKRCAADAAALAEGRPAAGRRGVRLDALRGGCRRLVGRLPAQLAESRGRRGQPGLRVLHGGDGAGAAGR